MVFQEPVNACPRVGKMVPKHTTPPESCIALQRESTLNLPIEVLAIATSPNEAIFYSNGGVMNRPGNQTIPLKDLQEGHL